MVRAHPGRREHGDAPLSLPLALLIEAAGWRAGYAAGGAYALVVVALVAALVRDAPPSPDTGATPERTIAGDAREVVLFLFSPALAGMVVLAFVSFAAVIGVRGLWAGPWLMDVKGLSRIAAGNVLLVATVALVAGPALWGIADRRLGRRRALLAAGHLAAAALLAAFALGRDLSPAGDTAVLLAFGITISVQPLIFAVTRDAVPAAASGKAMAAVNLSFFLGAAVLQAVSGPLVGATSIAGGLLFYAVVLAGGTVGFLLLTRRTA